MPEFTRHERALELDKVLERLAAEASMADGRESCLALRPALLLADAGAMLGETEEAWNLTARFSSPSFGGARNPESALSRAKAGAALSMGELLLVAETLRVIRSLSEWRGRCAGVESSALDRYFEVLSPNKYLEEKITSAILSEDEMADSASPALYDIRRKIRVAGSKVRDQLDKMIRSATTQKFLQDSVVTLRGGRFVLPVKTEHRAAVPGLVHDMSASGATVFIEPMGVVEQNNEIRVLEGKEEAEIERILASLSADVADFADGIALSYEQAVALDVIFAKAKLAYLQRAAAPRLNDTGTIRLDRARHPLLDAKTVVPVSLTLGADFDALIITGPNTGGKTVALKTIGLLCLMAACGLMIPAGDDSEVCVFGGVFADIGDEQSIEQSLSTFSSHMTNIVDILSNAQASSRAAAGGFTLVLLDELGAGTDPAEGAALATALIERFRALGAKLAATTHYAELKSYAIETPRVENACCEFDVASLRPTYRLLIGQPGKSNAFAISERLGMPPDVIERAKGFVSAEAQQFDAVVARLEESRQELERGQGEAAQLRQELTDARRVTELERERAEKEREAVLLKARQDAARMLEKARAGMDDLLRETENIRKAARAGETAEAARRARALAKSGLRNLEDAANPVSARRHAAERHERPLKAGDSVLIVDIDKKATVLEAPKSGGNGSALVQAGIIQTRVPLDNLRLLGESAKNTSAPPRRTGDKPLTREGSAELDLRGKSSDEALLELDQFLDNALISGLHIATVIHGKGTGVLRAAVTRHLRGHPAVQSSRLGVYGEGEDGVTVVELRE